MVVVMETVNSTSVANSNVASASLIGIGSRFWSRCGFIWSSGRCGGGGGGGGGLSSLRRRSLSSGLCSGRTQYSAQSPQRTAGERNTTPLSHLADVPRLLDSLPHPSALPLSLPPFSLAQYLIRVLYKWARMRGSAEGPLLFVCGKGAARTGSRGR